MKNCTNLKQSKKLSEFLSPESADNVIIKFGDREGTKTVVMPKETFDVLRTPFADIRETTMCWSFSALLNILPSATLDTSDDHYCRLRCQQRCTDWYDNPIDACIVMIEKLHE